MGRRYRLPSGACSIGRNTQNTITLDPGEKSVTGHHAIIHTSPDRIFIQDLQSTNGTFVNDIQVDEHDLKPGDIIGFGRGGPRLRLLVSENELPLNGGEVSGLATDVKTTAD